MDHRRSIVALGLTAALTVSACTAREPSAKRVAQELIESLAPTPEIEQCMLDVLDTYTKDELDDIGSAIVGDNVVAREEAELRLAEFEAELGECN